MKIDTMPRIIINRIASDGVVGAGSKVDATQRIITTCIASDGVVGAGIKVDAITKIIITGITTIGGVLGLLSHTLVPAAQLGVLTALGIAFALILSLWLLPATMGSGGMSRLPIPPRPNLFRCRANRKWTGRILENESSGDLLTINVVLC